MVMSFFPQYAPYTPRRSGFSSPIRTASFDQIGLTSVMRSINRWNIKVVVVSHHHQKSRASAKPHALSESLSPAKRAPEGKHRCDYADR
jgi:hypothetical protein